MSFDYDVDTAIDPDDLVEEWLRLPANYRYCSKELADKDKEVKEKWDNVKVTRSRLVLEAKEEGAKNEAEREAYYRGHSDHQKAKKELIEAEYERDLIKTAISALHRKEKAMEWVSRLAQMEYWSGPKVMKNTPGGKRLHSEARGRTSEKQMERLNKNRKPRRSRRRKD